MIPVALNMAPTAVTYLQLNRWHNALVIGAVASASVVIIPGIQAASAIDVPTSNVMIILNEKIYESISSAYKALRIISEILTVLEENNEHKNIFTYQR